MASMAVAWLAYTILFMANPSSGQLIFDVTKYGALADGTTDNSKAFLDAWNASCVQGGDTSFVVPPGMFLVGPVTFKGPCCNNSAPRVEIQGVLRAPSSFGNVSVDAWIEFRWLQGLTVGGGGAVDGQGAEAWNYTLTHKGCKEQPISMRFIDVNNAAISNLTFLNSKGIHLAIQRSSYIKVHNLNISAPGSSPNTDGVHISGSNVVDVADLTIGTGDDCVAVGQGAANVSISGVVCGPGHGISIGSLGKYQTEQSVAGVRVTNCTMSNTTNGVRIKTWPGSPSIMASNFTFENITLVGVFNPIIIDQVYCPIRNCTDQPSLVKVSDVTYKNIKGTSMSPVAVSLMCSPSVPCENVQLQDINLVPAAPVVSNMTSSCSNVNGTAIGFLNPNLCI